MRNRTFVYQTDKANFENLKEIESIFHIFGNKDGLTYGLITFANGRSIKSAEKIINYPVKISENTLQTIDEIKKMNDCWEKGKSPKRGASLETKKIKEIDLICKLILKQNHNLINMLNEDKNILVKQNQLLQESNIELNKTIQQFSQINNTIHQTIDNSDNSRNKKITNINLFLNTECKDAITLSDFVKQIQITDYDVVRIKEHGYAESVSNILQNALKDYNLYNRPIHCSDIKREVLHVKDDEGWKKETPQGESTNIDKAFRHISTKQTRKVLDYYKDYTSESEEKIAMMHRVAKATGSENEKSKKKIIKTLVDSIHI